MYELIEYTNEHGTIVTVRAKIENGVKISNIPVEKEWKLTTQSVDGTTSVDFLGHKPKK